MPRAPNSVTALTGADRRFLRAQAHGLRPAVQIGKAGVTDTVIASVDQSLLAHELIKVQFVDFKEEKKALIADIAARTGAEIAGIIGHQAILYRPHPDPARRRIRLPRGGGTPDA